MKKLLASFLCLSLLLCGCSKIKQAKQQTAEEIYKAAGKYFDKHVKNFEMDLDIDYNGYDGTLDLTLDRTNQEYLGNFSYYLFNQKAIDAYVYVQESKTDYMFATPITPYIESDADNEVILGILGLVTNHDSLDLTTSSDVNIEDVTKDDDNNIVVSFNFNGKDNEYELTTKISKSLFTSGTLTIYDENKENKKGTIDYTISNINSDIDLASSWDDLQSLKGQSMK